MMTRKKVVPPVTPRIVQARPGQQLFRYAFLLCAFLLAVWLSYEYGLTQAPTNDDPAVAQSSASKQHITELEQERDTLKQQVAELERSVRKANQALAEAGARSQTPKQAPKPSVTAPDSADHTLALKDIRLEQTDAENVFRIGFSVINESNSTDRVIGTIWIAVNGLSGKEPRRLSFNALSSDKRTYVKMGFNQQQDITEEIVLPDGFQPKNIMIEAKPYGEKYTGASEKVIWP